MASDYYLHIKGVTGESQAQGMSEYIELDSFSFGASNPADVGGKGLASGKASLGEFSGSCGIDEASYQILRNLYQGAHIDTCTFAGRKTGSNATPLIYLQVIMTNCFITQHHVSGGAVGIPTQSFSIAYEQIEYDYNTQDTKSGQVTLAGKATYNIGAVQQT